MLRNFIYNEKCVYAQIIIKRMSYAKNIHANNTQWGCCISFVRVWR